MFLYFSRSRNRIWTFYLLWSKNNRWIWSFGFQYTNINNDKTFSRDLTVNELHKTFLYYTTKSLALNFSTKQFNKEGDIKYYFRIKTPSNNLNFYSDLINNNYLKDNNIYIKTYYNNTINDDESNPTITIDFNEIGNLAEGDLFDIYLYDENNKINNYSFAYTTENSDHSYTKILNPNTLYENETWDYKGTNLSINISNTQFTEDRSLPFTFIIYLKWKPKSKNTTVIADRVDKLSNILDNIGYKYVKVNADSSRVLLFSERRIFARSLFSFKVNKLNSSAVGYGFYYRNSDTKNYSYTKSLDVDKLYIDEEWLYNADEVYLNFSPEQLPSFGGEIEIYYNFPFEDSLTGKVYNLTNQKQQSSYEYNLIKDSLIENKILVQNPTTSLEQFNTSTADVSIIKEDNKYYMLHASTLYGAFGIDIKVMI